MRLWWTSAIGTHDGPTTGVGIFGVMEGGFWSGCENGRTTLTSILRVTDLMVFRNPFLKHNFWDEQETGGKGNDFGAPIVRFFLYEHRPVSSPNHP